MPAFMVERYLPALEASGVERQARRDEALAAAAGGVRHLRTTYTRADELCFSFFEAPSGEAVMAANVEAGAAYERIVEVIDVAATS